MRDLARKVSGFGEGPPFQRKIGGVRREEAKATWYAHSDPNDLAIGFDDKTVLHDYL